MRGQLSHRGCRSEVGVGYLTHVPHVSSSRAVVRRVRCTVLHAAATDAASGSPPRVVVVGGGWAGFGAAKHLAEQGYQVKLLEVRHCRSVHRHQDRIAPPSSPLRQPQVQYACAREHTQAAKNPGGLSGGFRTASGKVVEAGMKGFWYSYSNIFNLLTVSFCATPCLPPFPAPEILTSQRASIVREQHVALLL